MESAFIYRICQNIAQYILFLIWSDANREKNTLSIFSLLFDSFLRVLLYRRFFFSLVSFFFLLLSSWSPGDIKGRIFNLSIFSLFACVFKVSTKEPNHSLSQMHLERWCVHVFVCSGRLLSQGHEYRYVCIYVIYFFLSSNPWFLSIKKTINIILFDMKLIFIFFWKRKAHFKWNKRECRW